MEPSEDHDAGDPVGDGLEPARSLVHALLGWDLGGHEPEAHARADGGTELETQHAPLRHAQQPTWTTASPR